MKQKTLSICIPVYNRREIFKQCLIKTCEACIDYSDETEIVIADNNSDEDLFSIYEEIISEYENIESKYIKNNINIGMAGNYVKVGEAASGKFCWIIGSDDFIKRDGVKILLDLINHNKDVDYISCNYDLIYLNEVINKDSTYSNLSDFLGNDEFLIEHSSPRWSGFVDKLDDLIDSKFNNVFLGSAMTGIFRKSIWDAVDKTVIFESDFNTLESIYPQCFIYANGFLGRKAYFVGEPLITVGEGTREWSTDQNRLIWDSSIPLIYLTIFSDMIDEYKINGLEKKRVKNAKNHNANIVSGIFLSYIFRRYFSKKYIKNAEHISTKKIILSYWDSPNFYVGVLKSAFSKVKSLLQLKSE